jgi:vitamin-K-epoxide reductase (warfarin-sensitive)
VRWFIALLALAGLVAASLALREHYRTGTSPCSINDKWDCGIVNKSDESAIAGIPVAGIGIAGYLLLGALAIKKAWRILAAAAVVALGFSLYLTYIEARVLEVWCIYCVISLGVIVLITILSVIVLLKELLQRPRPSAQ